MKKMTNRISVFALALLSSAALFFTGCPNVNGLHNQASSEVTFVFTGFPENVNGDYSVPGDFNGDSSWENDISNLDVTMKNGEGTSKSFTVTSSWIKFSLIKLNDVSWSRGWYPAVKGNVEDTGTAGNPKQNFYIGGLEPGKGDITIKVDVSSGVAVLTVE